MRRLALFAFLVLPLAGCGWLGAIALPSAPPVAHEALASEIKRDVPTWIKAEQLPPAAVPGARLFADAGCTACHNYDGVGGGGLLGAPDLTAEGLRNSNTTFQIRHLECPSCTHPGSPMPGFRSLGQKRLRELAIFLVDSKGASS